jgi:hypothetical protein
MKLRERVIDLSARIAALRNEIDENRTELVGMERELDTLLNQHADASTPAPQPTVKVQVGAQPGAANGHVESSIGERIKAILEADLDGEYKAEDFEKMMAGTKVDSIRAALARMTDEDVIVRSRRGHYQAKPRD